MTTAKLPLPSRIMAAQYKVFHAIRHPRALEAARQPGTHRDLAGFERARQCLLVTFKRSGEPVPTPVNFAISDGRLYFRTEPHVAKVKRLRRDPHVRICPCNPRGRPLGPMVEATTRVLPESETERAYEIVASNWRVDTRVLERAYDLIGVPTVYVEVTPTA